MSLLTACFSMNSDMSRRICSTGVQAALYFT
jgi:hypothetical protein